MADDDHRTDGEDHHHHHQDEILLLTYPSAVYYVQSPSTHSSNTDFRNNESSTFVSPYRSENYISNPTNASQDVSRSLLSHYSSSRGSNNSFLHEKKITYDVHDDCHENGMEEIDEDDDPCLVLCESKQKKVVQENEDEDFYDDDDYYEDDRRRKLGFWRFFSFGTYNSFIWFSIQIFWRLLVSFGAALFVFFLATNPPTPNMSIKMVGIRQFGLGEGVDGSGVTTKILTCNCSMALVINNKSKLFGLHIHPSTIQMSFGPLVFASSSPGNLELYASSYKSSMFELYVGTKNKAMYGAGRTMQDMLESGKGLPLKINMSLKSNFRVVWNLIKTTYNHHVECSLLLHRSYDKRHRTQTYHSDCKIISTK